MNELINQERERTSLTERGNLRVVAIPLEKEEVGY